MEQTTRRSRAFGARLWCRLSETTALVSSLAAVLLATSATVASAGEPAEACGVVPLVAGGGGPGIVVGRVLADHLTGTVTFNTEAAEDYYFGTFVGSHNIDGNWNITSVHVAVSCAEPPEFPVTKDGNPKVGRFPYSENSLPPGTQEWDVDISTASCSGETYVAAHATVTQNDETYEVFPSETAWGIELPFSRLTGASQWAHYFHFDTGACQTEATPPKLPENGRPVANPDSYQAQQDTQLSIVEPPGPGLLANDVDPDGDSIFVEGGTGIRLTTAGGEAVLFPTGAFTYTPPPGFTGTDSFLYSVKQDSPYLTSDPAKVTIRVSAREVTPPEPTPLICTQCTGMDCLLHVRDAACPSGTDVCYTKLVDSNGRTVTRGCASTQDPAPPPNDSECEGVEGALIGTGDDPKTCNFYCNKNNCNVPPDVIPKNGRVYPYP